MESWTQPYEMQQITRHNNKITDSIHDSHVLLTIYSTRKEQTLLKITNNVPITFMTVFQVKSYKGGQ